MASPIKPPAPATDEQRALLESKTIEQTTLTYNAIRNTYYAYYDDANIPITDGFVGLHESSFWPQLHQKLNPEQKPYKAQSLAIFNAHHFAVAYGDVIGKKNSNPFPRRALLLAIADYLTPVGDASDYSPKMPQ